MIKFSPTTSEDPTPDWVWEATTNDYHGADPLLANVEAGYYGNHNLPRDAFAKIILHEGAYYLVTADGTDETRHYGAGRIVITEVADLPTAYRALAEWVDATPKAVDLATALAPYGRR